MKIDSAKNIAIFDMFSPKFCHIWDKHFPYFLPSIWQPCLALRKYSSSFICTSAACNSRLSWWAV